MFPCAAPDFDSASPQIKIVPLTFLCRHFYSFIQQLLLDYLDVARLLIGRKNTNVKTTRPLASQAFQPASVTSPLSTASPPLLTPEAAAASGPRAYPAMPGSAVFLPPGFSDASHVACQEIRPDSCKCKTLEAQET